MGMGWQGMEGDKVNKLRAINTNSMRIKILIVLLFTICSCIAHTQDTGGFRYEPYFNAVIVMDVDISAAWYQSLLNMKIINRINDTARGFRAIIMESPGFLLELIENKSWPDQKKILADKPAGTRVQGFFKIGFKVPDINDCLRQLAGLKIIPERIYTDSQTKKKNFLIDDPDGNLVQFFE